MSKKDLGIGKAYKEEGYDKVLEINGKLIASDSTKDTILGLIEEYRNKEYFTIDDRDIYDGLIAEAEKKGYITSENAATLSSLVPKGGEFKSTSDPDGNWLSQQANNNYSYEEYKQFIEKNMDTYPKHVMDDIIDQDDFVLTEAQKAELHKMVESHYDEVATQQNDMISAADMAEGVQLAEQREAAEKELGDFHFGRFALIRALGLAVEFDSKVATANSLTNSLEVPKHPSDWSTYNDFKYFNGGLSGYSTEEIELEQLNTLVTEFTELLNETAQKSADYNDRISSVAKNIASLDPEFAQDLKDYFTAYTKSTLEGLQSGTLAIDLKQFMDTIHTYLSTEDIKKMNLSDQETKFLEMGISQINWENMSESQKFLNDLGMFVVGTVEGFAGKVEGITDGALALVGGVAAGALYLAGAHDAASSVSGWTRQTVAVDWSAELYNNCLDTGSGGLNAYRSENSDIRKLANATGELGFSMATKMLPGGVGIWLDALASTGKMAEKYAGESKLSDAAYFSSVAGTALVSFIAGKATKYLKDYPYNFTVDDYVRNALQLSGVGAGKGVAELLIQYNIDVKTNKFEGSVMDYVFTDNRGLDILTKSLESVIQGMGKIDSGTIGYSELRDNNLVFRIATSLGKTETEINKAIKGIEEDILGGNRVDAAKKLAKILGFEQKDIEVVGTSRKVVEKLADLLVPSASAEEGGPSLPGNIPSPAQTTQPVKAPTTSVTGSVVTTVEGQFGTESVIETLDMGDIVEDQIRYGTRADGSYGRIDDNDPTAV